jgi:hypothetical protein
MLLPTIISYILTALVSGAAISVLGYYAAFMLIGSVIHSIGNGLIITFDSSTPMSKWIGFQILVGIGGGLGLQASMLPAQTVLSSSDVAIGLAALNFASVVGGAIFTSVGELIYTNTLSKGFSQAGIQADVQHASAQAGVTSVTANLTGTALEQAKGIYDHGIRNVFYLSTAMACVSVLGAAGMEWISVRKDEKEDKSEGRNDTSAA